MTWLSNQKNFKLWSYVERKNLKNKYTLKISYTDIITKLSVTLSRVEIGKKTNFYEPYINHMSKSQ